MLVQPQLLGRGAQGQQITGFQRIARDQQAEHFQRVGIAPLFVGAMTDRVQRLLLRLVQPLQAPIEAPASRIWRNASCEADAGEPPWSADFGMEGLRAQTWL